MSLASLTQYIGRQGTMTTKTEGFTLTVTVLDVRERFGWVDYYVQPIEDTTGLRSRATWVQSDRVTLYD